ncbi:MAG: hypothetical protein HXX13_10220 [Bacteroidetes bacterium]|nr:hypothetical protein [Bacteroidota bacterium]
MDEKHNTFKMQEEPAAAEPTPEKAPEKKNKGKNRLRWVLDGTFLSRDYVIRQLPFLLVITLIGLIYIFNSNYTDKTIIQISRTKNELEELRFNYINTKSKLMQGTRQSELVHRLEARGVKESMVPPRKIIIPEPTN